MKVKSNNEGLFCNNRCLRLLSRNIAIIFNELDMFVIRVEALGKDGLWSFYLKARILKKLGIHPSNMIVLASYFIQFQ